MLAIGEQISVVAAFGGGSKLKPLRFRWSGRQIDIREITYEWATMNGKTKRLHFSVTDGNTLYELSFDTGSVLWRLEGVET
ncbi:MAG: hypothetical protein C4538_11355 [Nitrospiraceae bacterium]|nr:MAG: hypothetical protein C4538_11355 [Nitrospiraceae bacterium]